MILKDKIKKIKKLRIYNGRINPVWLKHPTKTVLIEL